MSRLPVRPAVPILLALCAWLAPGDVAADPGQAGKDPGKPVSGARGARGGAPPPVVITINESVGLSDKPGDAPPPKSDTPAKHP